MHVEIRKAGFVNKGAELMLHSIIQEMDSRFSKDIKYVMAPGRDVVSTPYEKRAHLGLYQKPWFWRAGFQLGDFANILPNKVRTMYGLVLDKEIDVVLDASGFSYSDQWGVDQSQELSRASKRWRKNGTKVILLPQAFGPFKGSKSEKAVRSFVENCDLIYARDNISYKHLTDIVGQRSNIKIYPDFTNLMSGSCPDYFDSKVHQVCIIPNCRMLDKTKDGVADSYIPFLVKVINILKKNNMPAFLLVHEKSKDYQLSQEISRLTDGTPIVQEDDPIKIKGLLGNCKATVGSRFHGLVSSLSQGVPAFATGWSHKYAELFNDYDFNDGMLDVNMSDEDLELSLSQIIETSQRDALAKKLEKNSDELKAAVQEMWREIEEFVKN